MAEHAVALTGEQWLAAHGYSTAPHDLCWLACSAIGFLKTYRGREICLCLRHAQYLEERKSGGSYQGIPLPAASIAYASEWPWRPAVPIAVAEAW